MLYLKKAEIKGKWRVPHCSVVCRRVLGRGARFSLTGAPTVLPENICPSPPASEMGRNSYLQAHEGSPFMGEIKSLV